MKVKSINSRLFAMLAVASALIAAIPAHAYVTVTVETGSACPCGASGWTVYCYNPQLHYYWTAGPYYSSCTQTVNFGLDSIYQGQDSYVVFSDGSNSPHQPWPKSDDNSGRATYQGCGYTGGGSTCQFSVTPTTALPAGVSFVGITVSNASSGISHTYTNGAAAYELTSPSGTFWITWSCSVPMSQMCAILRTVDCPTTPMEASKGLIMPNGYCTMGFDWTANCSGQGCPKQWAYHYAGSGQCPNCGGQ